MPITLATAYTYGACYIRAGETKEPKGSTDSKTSYRYLSSQQENV